MLFIEYIYIYNFTYVSISDRNIIYTFCLLLFYNFTGIKFSYLYAQAMKVPEKRERIGEVVPIIRSMSPPQKLAMATIISKRISNNDTTSSPFEEVRSLLGNGNRENASRELMLPISMDIAKIISNASAENGKENEEVPEALPEVS